MKTIDKNREPNVDRILNAFKFKKSDRVPTWELIIDGRVSSHILGKPVAGTCVLDPVDHLRLIRTVGMDVMGFGITLSPGLVYETASDGTSHYADGCIKGWDDLKKIEVPDFKPMFDKLEQYLEITRNTGAGVWVYVLGPFTPAYCAMGMQDFMIQLYDDFKFVEHLTDYILEVNSNIVKELTKYPVSFVLIADDIALKHGPMIQPDLFKQMWYLRMQRLIEPLKKKGMPLMFHSDGNLMQVMPLLIELGFSAVCPVEPIANNIYDIKDKFGDKICLVGNIDIAGVLAFGTPDEVKKDVKLHIEKLSRNSGYVVSSSSSVTDAIPPENYVAMVEAVMEYGKY